MPLAKTFSRHVSHPRRIIFLSASAGLIFFLLFISISLTLSMQRHAASHDRLATWTQRYLSNVFSDLQSTLEPLQAATLVSCEQVRADLTQRAAFAANIRAILLVKNDIAFCSSATGPMSLSIHQISPFTDASQSRDIRLIAGTPMVRKQPALVLWLANNSRADSGIFTTLNIDLTPYLLLTSRQQEITGMAIAAGGQALTTWNERVIDRSALPDHPLRTVAVPGYPLTLYLYGDSMPQREIHLILLSGLLIGVVIACACYLLLMLRLRPGKEILLGIKRGEFHVEYQPVVDAQTGQPYGVEALMRWTHPTEGRIPPDAFISYAEGQNLIVPLTRHLFSLIARDAHQLREALPAGTRLGVNLSPLHLSHPTFRHDVNRWLAAMPEGHFVPIFEITERAMMSGREADDNFEWMRQQQIRIAIDDFGTGHSALIYLEKFQFDYLKIDRGFVQSIGMETVNTPVLDTVLALAKKLNLNTVAEGVETAEQALWLINRGVTHMQGYLFSRPCKVPLLVAYYQNAARPAGATCATADGNC
ncbi:cyclic di-GMP phosphodiesterase [Erwinia sp. E602]|uniref:cyclic di-GMP phosphodiesterase n=1 Tax=Erwinia sp. E602 TaxID=2675378 RepID=UPI001BA57EFA|nr:cyclic di-GMP phosphodiesterase [Erwinia sp. E602]QUG75058.1 cyclic di-GMP phosphodiesterase [Erwinia sp. E602]